MVVNSHGRGNLRGTPLRARNANVRLRPSSDVRVAHDGRLLMRSPTPPQAATAVRSQTRGKVRPTSLEAIAPENRMGSAPIRSLAACITNTSPAPAYT